MVSYEEYNLYQIYQFLTRKIHKIWNIDIDKSFLYNKSKFNFWKFVDIEWEELDDFLFADQLEFDKNLFKKIIALTSTFKKTAIN